MDGVTDDGDSAADVGCARDRRFRKSLLKAGFSFTQKSLCWRWVHSPEKAEAVRHAVEAAVRPVGSIFLWMLPDRIFDNASHWKDGSPDPMPQPPDPWIIV